MSDVVMADIVFKLMLEKEHGFHSLDLLSKYGVDFAFYHTYILDKYEKQITKTPKKREFYVVTEECKKKWGLSYHRQRKARELGKKLKWWKYKIKYNADLKGRVMHFTLDDKIAMPMLEELNKFREEFYAQYKDELVR